MHVETTYNLDTGDSLIVTSYTDNTVSLHCNDYQEGKGFSVRFSKKVIKELFAALEGIANE